MVNMFDIIPWTVIKLFNSSIRTKHQMTLNFKKDIKQTSYTDVSTTNWLSGFKSSNNKICIAMKIMIFYSNLPYSSFPRIEKFQNTIIDIVEKDFWREK